MIRLLLASALALTGCDPGFEPQYLVKDLRILAVQAEAQGSTSADVSVGDTLVLRALVANPRGRAGLAVSWYGCLPLADESLPPCADVEFLANPARLATDSRVVKLGTCEPDAAGVCAVAGAVPDVSAALSFALQAAVRDPAFSCRPYSELPVVAVANAEGRQTIALKRVRVVPSSAELAAIAVTDSYVTNSNPAIESVVRARPQWGTCTGGIAIGPDPFPSGETTLCATPATGWSQEFETCGPGGTRALTHESAEWQWFTTAGDFPEFDAEMAGNANRNEPRFIRPPGPFTIWTIMRDGRGGEGWLRRDVGAAP